MTVLRMITNSTFRFQLFVQSLNIPMVKQVQLFFAYVRNYIMADYRTISANGARSNTGCHVFSQPFIQPEFDGHFLVFGKTNTLMRIHSLTQLKHQCLLRACINAFSHGGTVGFIANNYTPFPATIVSFSY